MKPYDLFLRACAPFAAAAALPVLAQTALPTVTITGRTEPPLAIGGFGDIPLAGTPLQARSVDAEAMRDAGVTRLSDMARIDPAVADAYNAEGYWDSLTVRGFVIDNRFNYRRDGLPINAETSIALDNKERIELLKGLSGLQAGVSAPGGLVNLVVKRPTATTLRSATIGWRQHGSLLGAVDLSQRLGDAAALRVNAAYEHLEPRYRDARGHRRVIAVAAELAPTRSMLVEVEVETSHRSQPSVPGFSLTGDDVPDAEDIDPRLNLNNQPWTRPVVLDGNTSSLRVTQRLASEWRAVAHFGTQRLRSDDRTAFPFGCGAEDRFDRFCSDRSFDYYDFVSDHERRRTDALDLSLAGRTRWSGVEHRVQAGMLRSKARARFEPQLFGFAGQGRLDGSAVVPRSQDPVFPSTDRDEASTELYVRDSMQFGAATSAWLGLRHTRLHRRSVGTDGSEPTDARQAFTTPWLALAHEPAPGHLLYASWGRGVESDVVPNRQQYTNAGRALPALKSRQFELGWKTSGLRVVDWNVSVFDILRPLFADVPECSDSPESCARQLDGTQRHRGIELGAAWRHGNWSLDGGVQWLHARRAGSSDATMNGQRPVNVPRHSVKALAGYDVGALPGLHLQAALVRDGARLALPDGSARIDGWTRIDAAARYAHRGAGLQLVWRVGVDNVADRRAWKESPYQFGHTYLFPLAPRTWRLSLQAEL